MCACVSTHICNKARIRDKVGVCNIVSEGGGRGDEAAGDEGLMMKMFLVAFVLLNVAAVSERQQQSARRR